MYCQCYMIIHNIPNNRHAHVIYRRYIIADIGVVLNFIEVNSIIVFSCICNKNETTTCKISRKSQSYTVKEVFFFVLTIVVFFFRSVLNCQNKVMIKQEFLILLSFSISPVLNLPTVNWGKWIGKKKERGRKEKHYIINQLAPIFVSFKSSWI